MTRLPFGPEWGPTTRDDIVHEDSRYDDADLVDQYDNEQPSRARRDAGPFPMGCKTCGTWFGHYPERHPAQKAVA